MFDLESFTHIDPPRDLAKVFDSTEYARWKGFRESEDSRYMALTWPRMLMRHPYGKDSVPVDAFNYEEKVDGTPRQLSVGECGLGPGTRLNSAFAMYGWCASIRGVESGGLVEGPAGAHLHDRTKATWR